MANHEADSDVFPRDVLDDEDAAHFRGAWLHQLPNGDIEEFVSDDDACKRQREYRASVGLDPMTGEPEQKAVTA